MTDALAFLAAPLADALVFLAAAWALWALCNVLAFCLSARMAQPVGAYYDGFRIVVPAWLSTALTPRELDAVRQHEEGHRARLHPWRNLAMVCLLALPTRARLRAQETEADDFVRDPAAMASAIRKTSQNEFDLWRAARLERRALEMGGQEARSPAPGKGAS